MEPPDSGKAIIFRAKAKFFWQKPAPKHEKGIVFFVFIEWKKRNSFQVAPDSCFNELICALALDLLLAYE